MELITISADNNDIDRAPFTKLLGVYLTPGSDAATIAVYDAATVTGTAKVILKGSVAGKSEAFYFGYPGIPFKTAISVDITGTSAVAYLLVE